MDFGIGAYEFWGSPGVDTQLCYVSQCCEASEVPNTEESSIQYKWNVLNATAPQTV